MIFETFCYVGFFFVPFLLGLISPKAYSRRNEHGTGLAIRTRFKDATLEAGLRLAFFLIFVGTILQSMREWDKFREPTIMSYGWQIVALWLIFKVVTSVFYLFIAIGPYLWGTMITKIMIKWLYKKGLFGFRINKKTGQRVFIYLPKKIRKRRQNLHLERSLIQS